MNQDRLEKALEELSSVVPKGAAATLEANLKAAFRRYHVRRKRERQASLGLACISLVIIVGAIIFKSRGVRMQPEQSLVVNGAPKISPPGPAPTRDVSLGVAPRGGSRLV